MFFKTLLSNSSSAAPIQFSGNDDTNCFPVSGKDITVVSSDADHDVGSAKLHIKNIVNYTWEHKYHPGQVVAHDKSGKYVAYSITTSNKGCGIVRIINRESTDRILIKGMVGPVVDLSFSHSKDEVVIGIVDSYGNLFVYKIEEQPSGTASERLVEIMRPDNGQESLHRLIWCPYVPEPDTDLDSRAGQRMLVLTHGSLAEVWSLDTVLEMHGSGPLTTTDVEHGLMEIKEIGGDIVDAAFSPTGEAVAVAVSDGSVKFFQVYMHEEGPPRCLKSWVPHIGQSLSCLIWLDDHTSSSDDTRFWKFVVTGCNYNTELKVWCSSSWSCLQTLKLQRQDSDSNVQMRLKAVLDPSAQYLILSDIDARLLYVLNIEQSENKAEIVSVGEFASLASVLSLSCVSAGVKKVVMTTEGVEVVDDTDAQDNHNDDYPTTEKTVVKLYFVQPKSLQECSIIYDNAPRKSRCSLSPNTSMLPDEDAPLELPSDVSQTLSLPTIPIPAVTPPAPASCSSPRSQLPCPPSLPDLAEAASKISLLSPEQFKSPPVSEQLLPAPITVKQEPVTPPVLTQSGNSSPSREVAGILDDVQYRNNDDIEDVNDEDDEDEDEEEEEEQEVSFRDIKKSPSALNTSIKFPTPPVPPPVVTAMPSAGNLEEMESRLENVIINKMEIMEKKLEARYRQENQAVLERLDDLMGRLSISLNRKVEESVSTEVRRTLPNLVKKCFDGVEKDLSNKLSGMETKVAKELTSAQSRDLIGRSVASHVSNIIQTSYKQEFANQLIGMEQAFAMMIREVNSQFQAGTKEYEAALSKKMLEENTGFRDIVNPVNASIQGVQQQVGSLKEVVDSVKRDQLNIVKQINDKHNKAVTADEVRKIVHKEVTEAMSARSMSHTPQPDMKAINLQNTIKSKIKAGQYNDAFQTALSSSDLSLVIFTCENVNTTQVFNQHSTSPLMQEVLLSLIHQLAVDLADKTQVKHAYLHEALANLNADDPLTKAHMKPVLKHLEMNIQGYIQQNPSSKMTRNLKILAMAASELQRQ